MKRETKEVYWPGMAKKEYRRENARFVRRVITLTGHNGHSKVIFSAMKSVTEAELALDELRRRKR